MKPKKDISIWLWAVAGAILALIAPNLIILLLVVGVVWVCVSYSEGRLPWQRKEKPDDDDDNKPQQA